MDENLKRALQTQAELVEAVRILADILWKLGKYLYNHTDNPNLKSQLRELGEEIKRIRTPRKR